MSYPSFFHRPKERKLLQWALAHLAEARDDGPNQFRPPHSDRTPGVRRFIDPRLAGRRCSR